MSAPCVTILLSTYNGENYLQTQLDSFREQTHDAWRIAWRDDGSSDHSVAMVETFAKSAACVQSPSSGPHLGAAASFLQLLSENSDAPLIAFADQDDRWLPAKLQRAVAQLGRDDAPALYCARQMLTDDDFTHPELSVKFRCIPGFPASLTQNIATGNTVVMNGAAARLVASVPAPVASPHDWWSYIVVSACGGRIIFDARPQVLYRLHPHNLIGSAHSMPGRALAAIRRGPRVFMTMMRRHVDALAGHAAQLTPQARHELRIIQSALQGGIRARITALRCNRFRRRTATENLLFAYWFLTDRGHPAMLTAKDTGPRPHWASRERPAAE